MGILTIISKMQKGVSMLKLIESECSCDICSKMCTRPCWGTPEEIQKIIDAGLGHRLNKDFYGHSDRDDVNILGPALKGYEGKHCAMIPKSPEGCTFWKNGLCELHTLGLKPIEGRLAYHDNDKESSTYIHQKMIPEAWDTDLGRSMVKQWCDKYDVEINPKEAFNSIDIVYGLLDMLKLKYGITSEPDSLDLVEEES